MDLYYVIVLFIFGTVFGSFYNVVGTRLANGESIVFPPSHCESCGHKLRWYELIPIFSFLFQRGRCKKCGVKLSAKYLIYELVTGILFSLCYISFGFNLKLLLALTFISVLMIIIISDIDSYIIPDEVLIVGFILIFIEMIFVYDIKTALIHLVGALLAFILMYALKLFGDFLFKKESMGGGDIKLLFLIGYVIGIKMSIVSIFLSSFIGLPISIYILYKNKSHVIPYGPFLSIATMIIFLCQIDFDTIIRFLTF